MTTSQDSGVTLRDVFSVLNRHRTKCVVFFLTVTAVVTVWTLSSKRVYRSEGKLFVRLGRENIAVDPTATAGQAAVTVIPSARENEIASVLEILQSRNVMESVVDKLTPGVVLEQSPVGASAPSDESATDSPSSSGLMERIGLSEPMSNRERAIQQLAKAADISIVKKSSVISVAYEAHSPETARAIVAALIEACQVQQIHANRAPGSYQFLLEQTEKLKSHLNEVENQLRDVKTTTGLASLADQRSILVIRIGKLVDESLTTASALAAAEAQVREMKQGIAGVSPELITARTTGLPNMAADTMRSQLYALQLREKELGSKYRGEHPEMIAVRQQIKDAEVILDTQEVARVQETKGPNVVYATANTSILAQEPVVASLRAKAQSLQTQVADAKSALKALNDNEVLIARLQRELDLADTKYRKYSENVEQARIDEALELGRLSNISIVEAATLDPKSIRPKRMMSLGLGLVFAVFGAIGLALICEFSATRRFTNHPTNGELTLGATHPAHTNGESHPATIRPATLTREEVSTN